jgi:hypothetical protein
MTEPAFFSRHDNRDGETVESGEFESMATLSFPCCAKHIARPWTIARTG